MATEQDATRVDLAEDLLAEPPPLSPTANPTPEKTPEEWFRHAQVLASEGYIEDAKSAYRRVLIDPAASEMLKRESALAMDALHLKEIDQLLGAGSRSPSERKRVADEASAEIAADLDAELTLEQLERDLGLGELELFSDVAELLRVRSRFKSQSAGLTPSERIDLGIAWLEMDQFALAEDQFTEALSDVVAESLLDQDLMARLVLLQSEARIRQAGTDGYFRAVSALESLLANSELDERIRIDAGYWMGRALEALGRHTEAYSWYESILSREPRYRDTASRAERERARASRNA